MQLLNSFLTILAETAAFPLKNLLTGKFLMPLSKGEISEYAMNQESCGR